MHHKFILVSELNTIEKRFSAKLFNEQPEIPKSYSVRLGDDTYIITEPNTIQVYRYGLTPHLSSEQLDISVARAEGDKNKSDDPNFKGSKAIFLQPEFKKPIFSQRCIVIADAFYTMSDKGQTYLVYLQDKCRPIGFAGIYDSWKNPETKEIVNGFAIITTTANQMLQRIGVKRMPVILPFQYETNWLKSTLHLSEVLKYLVPYQSEKMNAYPVARFDEENGDNSQSMIEPIGEKIQDETRPIPRIRSYYPHKTKTTPDQPYFRSAEEKTSE